MEYFLAGPGYTRIDKTPVRDRLFSSEQPAIDAAFRLFYGTPAVKTIDIMLVNGRSSEGVPGGRRLISLYRRAGKTDPAFWMNDEVTEPTR